jgi:hypothetical protein
MLLSINKNWHKMNIVAIIYMNWYSILSSILPQAFFSSFLSSVGAVFILFFFPLGAGVVFG